MISINRRNATVVAWAHASPDEISKRFHNMVLVDFKLCAALHRLDALFGYPAPVGRGRYNHHDGSRS